ncbi:hypothetical protein [Candidatus Kuenenia sp.]|uniref:hypothetical protein n=1 Tax=Candidatus Kuenenia sp. TaxID=2499824 RepID=UPI00321FCF3C
MNTKICARCGVEKPVVEFHKNSRNKDGLHSYCKTCNKEKAAKHLKTAKGKAALSRAIERAQDRGYYRYGKGAIPILRQGAQKRGISFELTAESLADWWNSQPDVCFYCGISLDEYLEIRDFILAYEGNNFELAKFKRFYRSPKHQSIRWMTIDRIHNEQGYKVENIAKVCLICNSLKSDFFDGDQMR